MKRIQGRRPLEELHSQPTSELNGFVEMGMKREALKLARRILKKIDISTVDFRDAMQAILIQADNYKLWTPVVESAYARLLKHDKHIVRPYMLYFYHSCKNYEAAAKFVPHRFVGAFDTKELAFACETWLELNRMDKMENLAKKLLWAIKEVDVPFMRTHLAKCLAEYYARKGHWGKAVELWEFVQLDNIFYRDAVEGVVDIHVAGALLAIKRGFELMKKFNQNYDPEMETTLPGNDGKIQRGAGKKFRKLQRLLEKVVPEKRRKELGLDN
jgi:hypothetical protein